PASGFRADDSKQREVVLEARNAGARGVADHLADVVDLPVALGTLAEEDVRILGPRDFVRAEGQRHHVERDAERFHALAQARQPVDRPGVVELCRGEPAADVIDAERGEHRQDLVGVVVLCADRHERLFRWDSGALADRFGVDRHAKAGEADEISALHGHLRRLRSVALDARPPVYRMATLADGGGILPMKTTITLVMAVIVAGATMAQRGGPPARPQGPCDIYAAANAPCVAAHSTTRALYAAYNGPLYQVLRQSDGTTLDVGVVQPVASLVPDAGG